jgi:hypothetical protein
MARFNTERNYDGWKFSLINFSLCNEGPAFQSQLKIKKCMKFEIFQNYYAKWFPVSRHSPAKTDQ